MMAPTSKPTHAVFFFLLLYSLSTLRPTSANYYWPDGTDRNFAANASFPGSADEYYAPCNPDAKSQHVLCNRSSSAERPRYLRE
jgi:hypothetical protein